MNDFLGHYRYYDKNSDGSVERMKMRQEHGNDGGSPVVVIVRPRIWQSARINIRYIFRPW